MGASRGVGLATVYAALDAGHEVRAMSRSAEDISMAHRNLVKISGDACDPEQVNEALRGCDIVITVIGISPTRKPVTIFSDCARTITQSMMDHNIKRLIAVTGVGAGDSKHVGGALYSRILRPMLLGTIYEDKNREEDIIRSSSLDWTIVRPGILTRLPKKGFCKVFSEKKDWEMGFITRSDLADFLVSQIDDEQYFQKTPLVIN